MGTKITAKYNGQCKICGDEWNVGESIFYQKEPKAICGDKECFEEPVSYTHLTLPTKA